MSKGKGQAPQTYLSFCRGVMKTPTSTKLGEIVNVMFCKSCLSENQRNFNGEIAIHFHGLKGLDKPIVWVFPKLLVCLGCGLAEFKIAETELRQLVENDAADT
jgi:hypothetical protein